MHQNNIHTNGNKLFSFPKKEKLTSKTTIDRLFKEGESRFKYPFRILFLSADTYTEYFPQVLISVSKRNFKRAVDRNRIKRLIREAYRLQKNELLALFPVKPASLAILYTAKEEIQLEELKKKLYLIIKMTQSDNNSLK
ncbi:ribonuclease P protein component [Cytophaga hutchinsonii]|jgi:ribonuclease P protein component|uniref:Ribonuclease P protein component n=1 Tax=Cytophaga hutchinsonii (strain ATCC 33406 / DSM 1761 / CIP 103989 / NBRC 15051 / NCIMB 9469 / D465) TaxID=269798 RepID=A0A6N4SMA6_CYTH3|nr:ribonuclease P protein component [Cytophaga hutchinsonii]ABG57391.1 ribonuclease P protein component [Cytophaga hutchinsonii ATCC 33406]SFX47716.1 ribonuclease P protein component [Cytophaga hutchinsonii ATCC 33406]